MLYTRFLGSKGLLLMMISLLCACQSIRNRNIESRLPKDVVLMPISKHSAQYSQEHSDAVRYLEELRDEIELAIGSEKCLNAKDWSFVPLSSQPCGMTSYIAYPTKKAHSILPKINHYKDELTAFDRKFSIKNQCDSLLTPTTVICEEGRSKLAR